MLMRTDQFGDLDRLAQRLFGGAPTGTWTRPTGMPLDAYRDGEEFVVALDLPGVAPDAIDVGVERNVLTIKAERRPLTLSGEAQCHVSERPLGAFARQLFLSDALDTEQIRAQYDNGVLVLRIPVKEQAKPRKVEVASGPVRSAINA